MKHLKLQSHSERKQELDGLRGVAVTLVIALHIFIRPYLSFWKEHLGGAVAKLMDMAWCGVDIFFVLSGFLIGRIILEHLDSSNFYTTFYARRTTRIFPLYFFLVGLFFLLQDSLDAEHQGGIPLTAYITFTANMFTSAGFPFAFWLGPLWSVCIEEQFYLLAPFCLRKVSRVWLPYFLITLIVLSLSFRISCLLGLLHPVFSAWDFTFARLDGLGLGMLTAWLMRSECICTWMKANVGMLKLILTMLIFICFCFSQQTTLFLLGPGIFFISVASSVAILVMNFDSQGFLSQIMRGRFLVALGRYSYFLYLFHMPFESFALSYFQMASIDKIGSRIVVELCAMVLLYTAARMSWRYFEMPFLQYGHRFSY